MDTTQRPIAVTGIVTADTTNQETVVSAITIITTITVA
jgi:hypothetical protein